MQTGTDVTSDEIMEMYCEPCKRDGKPDLLAQGFCVKCEDFICSTCVLYHKRFFSDHNIKSRQEMSFEFDTGKCSEHHEECIKFYCERCDDFTCAICKKNCHSNCGLIKHLYEVVEAFEIKEGNEIVSKISILKCKASDLHQSIVENKELARRLKETIETDVEQHRKELNAEFDQTENEIDTIESTDQDRLQNCAKELDKLDVKLMVIQTEIDSTEHKSKYKLFMGCKKAAKSMDKLKSDLESIQKNLFASKYNYAASKIGTSILQNQTKVNLGWLSVAIVIVVVLVSCVPVSVIYEYVCIIAEKLYEYVCIIAEKLYEYVCIIAEKLFLLILRYFCFQTCQYKDATYIGRYRDETTQCIEKCLNKYLIIINKYLKDA